MLKFGSERISRGNKSRNNGLHAITRVLQIKHMKLGNSYLCLVGTDYKQQAIHRVHITSVDGRGCEFNVRFVTSAHWSFLSMYE